MTNDKIIISGLNYDPPRLSFIFDLNIPYKFLRSGDKIVLDWRKGHIEFEYLGENWRDLKKRCIDIINLETDNYYSEINIFFDSVLCNESFSS
jgi:hypothetical protein